MQIEYRPIEQVKPYERNARVIPDKAVRKVADSIRAFGWRQPIVIEPDGTVVIGHVRLRAAHLLGLTTVPVHVATGLSSAQLKALRLADNRTHEEASWDLELLRPELAELKGLDLDLSLTGFDGREIRMLLVTRDDREENVPELPATPVAQTGDVWALGPHRVLCGDSTSPEAVARLLGPTSAKPPLMMVTDPPYGVKYDPAWREEGNLTPGLHKPFNAPNKGTGLVSNDDRVEWTPAYKLFPGSIAYVWHAGVYAGQVGANLNEAGFDIRAQIIWRKQHFVFGRGAYHWQHEPCWYAIRKGAGANWQGDRKQTTVWDVANLNPMGGNKDEEMVGHGTQKPVEVMRRPILNHTTPGTAVYDCFLGSGSTLIAAETTERICYGLEIDPRYVDVIVNRWEAFTGRKAECLGRQS